MDHAERLRRRREQYRARRDRETPEETEIRLASRQQYDRRRYAALTLDQQHTSTSYLTYLTYNSTNSYYNNYNTHLHLYLY